MSGIQVVKYAPEHLKKIRVKESQRGEVPDAVMGASIVTFLWNDMPVAIFGGFFIGQGVMHIWGFVSDEVRKIPLEFHRTCDKMLALAKEHYKLRRIQIDVRESFIEGVKWANILGFICEGKMRSFHADEDCYLLAKVG